MENQNDVKFMSISDFKAQIGKSGFQMEVLKNETKNTLFVGIDGSTYKCKQTLDTTLPVRFLVPYFEDQPGVLDTENACLVNVKSTATVLMTL